MGGTLWSTWRSTRGIELTYRMLEFRRWSQYGIAALWHHHINLGIAPDGAPTGVEHAFRFESFQPDLVVLWSRWRDHSGARRLRELFLDMNAREALTTATHDAVFVQGPHPLLARAIDLDVLHWHAHDAVDLKELAVRWRESVRFHDLAMPRSFPTEVHSNASSRRASDTLAQRHAACDGIERELLAQIEADPRSDANLLVYADWLETAGRIEEASVVRARMMPG